jgi:hypothetical protein
MIAFAFLQHLRQTEKALPHDLWARNAAWHGARHVARIAGSS